MFVQNKNIIEEKNRLKLKAKELENFIRYNIPMTDYLDISIKELTPYSIIVSAPLKPNGNHYGTVFGGSISTLGIVSCWALLHQKMVEDSVPGTLVIQESDTKFLKPARGEFEARCSSLDESSWQQFKDDFALRGKAKKIMRAELYCNNELIAVMEGNFTALGKAR
ncbi:MAG: thioesterase domain-containing protein [Melioribacteraceae bacterium]|nr:thioesterase domain-containing protein [Melioribacteraceae bacterium]